ncbi:unnamed protein product [Heterobilharzia americana]|nr:unnamed protein product [Heterobilharzia americana]
MEVNEYLLQISPAAYFFSHWFKHLLSTLNPCQSTNTENILNDTHKEIHNDGTDSNKTCITDNYTEVSKYYRNIQEQDRNLLITQRRNMQHRAVFSEVQRRGLESAFRKHAYITKPDRKLLAERLGLRDVQVKIWFQNRRMKWRNLRQNCRNTPVNSNQSEQKRKSTKKSEKRSDISMSIVNSSRHSINLDIIPQNPDIDISNQLSQMHTSVVPCLLMKDKLNEIKSTEK